jgi:hypothetical protein
MFQLLHQFLRALPSGSMAVLATSFLMPSMEAATLPSPCWRSRLAAQPEEHLLRQHETSMGDSRRPRLAEPHAHIAGCPRVVVVEDASRFARELMTQELGLAALIKLGVRVVTAAGDDLTDTSDPSRVIMRQIVGSFAEYEKGAPRCQAACGS